jgi:hypothetical protein
VRNSESPIITGVGGICCPPIECLRKPSTTTTLVKDVNMISIAGTKVMIVRKIKRLIRGSLTFLRSKANALLE